jgi:hypothetical protein
MDRLIFGRGGKGVSQGQVMRCRTVWWLLSELTAALLSGSSVSFISHFCGELHPPLFCCHPVVRLTANMCDMCDTCHLTG